MIGRPQSHRVVLLLAALLVLVTGLTLKPYGGNVSALFHIDRSIADAYTVPPGTVVLSMPGYDGMEYFQMARNMPVLFNPARWDEIRTLPPGPYAHQRFLLPAAAYLLAFGQDDLLPYAFLLINIFSLLAACIVMGGMAGKRKFYGLMLALCPAAMVGMHFMLAEPLNLLLLTLFLWRYTKTQRIDTLNILLLSLCVLSREINLIFVLGVGAWSLYNMRWRDAVRLLIPVGVFVALHTFIFAVFHTAPFLWSTEKSTLPLLAVWELLSGQKGFNQFTLSSIALFVLFVLPAFVRVALGMRKDKRIDFVPAMLIAFLGLMMLMPDHIWGSITSIGRVITPVYPLFFVYASERNEWPDRVIAAAVGLVGLAAGIGLALIAHPFTLA